MKNNKRKSNHEIVACIYFFSALFFAMIAYMVYFVGFRAADLMGNPYNARTEVFNDQFIRGNILSSDGQILAKTEITENKDQDGNATTIEKEFIPSVKCLLKQSVIPRREKPVLSHSQISIS